MTAPLSQPKTGGICVLVSGGLDSGILLQDALAQGRPVYPLYVQCGFHWEETEAHWLDQLLKRLACAHLFRLRKIPVPMKIFFPKLWPLSEKKILSRKSLFIPGRNFLLLSQAGLFCRGRGLEEIWIGSLQGNTFSDTKAEFFSQFERFCEAGLKRSIRVKAPFLDMTKAQLIRKNPNFPFDLTFTCLNPQGRNHCGICLKCFERQRHFKNSEIPDPTLYSDVKTHAAV